MKITIFPSVTRVKGESFNEEWRKIVFRWFAEPTIVKEKSDVQLYSFATFKDAKRSDSNVTSISALVFDFDGGSSYRDLAFEVEDVIHLAHSTFNNSANSPKWRLIVPLDREVTPEEYCLCFDAFYERIRNFPGLDKSCRSLSRCYYLPSCSSANSDLAFVTEGPKTDCDFISADKLLNGSDSYFTTNSEASSPGNPRLSDDAIGDGQADRIQTLGRNNRLKEIAVAMIHRGEGLERIIREVLDYDSENHTPPLFSDNTEGNGQLPPELNAARFVLSISSSLARKDPKTIPQISSPSVIIEIAEKGETTTKEKRVSLSDSLSKPPGLVGDVLQYILETSIKPQPEIALAASLVACGTVMGRKISTETDLRTNLYFLCLAETASGKEWPRRAIQKIFQEVGAFPRASVEDPASDSALLEYISQVPSQVLLLDEFGRFLHTTQSGQTTHLYNIPSLLLRLHGAANGPFAGKFYADSKKNKVIEQPNVSLLATTVQRSFYSSLTGESVTDGFLNRLLFLESSNPDPEINKVLNKEIPAGIISAFEYWEGLSYGPGNMQGIEDTRPTPRVFKASKRATAIFSDLESDFKRMREALRGDNLSGLYGRGWDMAQRIALILAGGTDPERETVTHREALWAAEFIATTTRALLKAVQAHVSDNRTQGDYKRILGIIQATGSSGIGLNVLARQTTTLLSPYRNAIIKALQDAGEVEEVLIKRPDSKKPTRVYRAIVDQDKTQTSSF